MKGENRKILRFGGSVSLHGPVHVLWSNGRPVTERSDLDPWGRPRNPQVGKVAEPDRRRVA
jgi:hypothetical protein